MASDELKARFPRWFNYSLNDVSSESLDRYHAALHAVQSAVKFELQLEREEALTKMAGTSPAYAAKVQEDWVDQSTGGPKHLRTGLNARASDHRALALLLVEKGVFTWDEYYVAVAEALELEAAELAEGLRAKTGLDVRFA